MEVKMETEVEVFAGGHIMAGCRRGPIIKRKSSGAQMNLRKADS